MRTAVALSMLGVTLCTGVAVAGGLATWLFGSWSDEFGTLVALGVALTGAVLTTVLLHRTGSLLLAAGPLRGRRTAVAAVLVAVFGGAVALTGAGLITALWAVYTSMS